MRRSSNTIETLFQPLLDFAEQHVPRSQISQTPIYFYATAGLRGAAKDAGERIFDDDDLDHDYMLDEDDEDFGQGKISLLLDRLREFVKEKSSFVFYDDHVKVDSTA